MHALAATAGAFLLAVIWFDLMFDVQVRAHREPALPPAVLSSIGSYYRRVTTDAWPMNRLVGVVMLVMLFLIAAEIVQGLGHRIGDWLSFVGAAGAIALAILRTVRNAVRLGVGEGTLEQLSQLARSIYRDHLYCLVSIAVVVALQLSAP